MQPKGEFKIDILLGHLVGDFLFQPDYVAKNKKNSHLICLLHCLIYTFFIYLFCPWMSWIGLSVCFAAHFIIDKLSLAKLTMENLLGQKEFANGPLSPWSVILIDQIFHLLTLYMIWKIL